MRSGFIMPRATNYKCSQQHSDVKQRNRSHNNGQNKWISSNTTIQRNIVSMHAVCVHCAQITYLWFHIHLLLLLSFDLFTSHWWLFMTTWRTHASFSEQSKLEMAQISRRHRTIIGALQTTAAIWNDGSSDVSWLESWHFLTPIIPCDRNLLIRV